MAAASLPKDTSMSCVKELVDKAIKDDKFLVFSKSYCHYCKRAKALLEKEVGAGDLTVFEWRRPMSTGPTANGGLDERAEDGAEIQAYLKSLNGQGTVPHVYIGGEFIGGNSDPQALPAATLHKKLEAARAA
ncbi:Glutaredoxin [Cryptotrichosporon argae]